MGHWLDRWQYAINDNFHKILRHRIWLVVLSVTCAMLVFLNFSQGQLKPAHQWVWIDIIGEGSSALCIVIWLLLVLSMRQPGPVTNWFALGFIGIFASSFQDLLDEWVHLPLGSQWDSWVESLPLGLLALTVAIWLKRKEQVQIDRYLTKRKAIYQDTAPLDETTCLPKSNHLSCKLEQAFAKGQANWQQHALILIDVVPFADISYRHGGREADRFLIIISELISLTLKNEDTLFHLAGGRFAIVLHDVNVHTAKTSAQELEQLIKQFRYRIEGVDNSIHLGASMVMVMAQAEGDSPEDLLGRASFALSQQNQHVLNNAYE
ncbi:GGDEF domain-containing protein [Marinomonas posidonica]|uniref:Diguanylate cyclase n=1 Tax=Marinomonas posidonica (strain CECT 7376 / NCIMB 14433 / IVIA-Po-181) TaxID=491952 RepID=F6CVT9_MARPP|nr:diguanylate cyclase [Marinomonas posidonica]AEF53147.1 diguanylate cyclase [Marinomonas posidonica IVIA-Po-181]